MRLAGDEITIDLGGQSVRLRARLRAALDLHRQHDGLDKLFAKIGEGHVGAIVDLIATTSTPPIPGAEIVARITTPPLRGKLDMLAFATMPLFYSLAGVDPDDLPKVSTSAPSSGKPFDLAEHFLKLYRLATGALGWTPEQAWNASPAEIVEGYAGRVDFINGLIRALFGTAEKNEPTRSEYVPLQLDEQGLDPTFDRAGLHALKSKMKGA